LDRLAACCAISKFCGIRDGPVNCRAQRYPLLASNSYMLTRYR